MDALDRPVWASLTTAHTDLSLGGPLARRYAPDINLFASARDDSDDALAALKTLVDQGDKIFVLQVPAIAVPRGLTVVKWANGVQMIAGKSFVAETSEAGDMVALTATDAPEMLALAQLTEPGPFLIRTPKMGRFIGIRRDGRLVAMAGERFRFPGYTEVSGVCTHPDFRGRGLARRLSACVAAAIAARGDTPFLHAWQTNRPAIALYESLGFVLRAAVNVAVLENTG